MVVGIELRVGICRWARGIYPGYQRVPFGHTPRGQLVHALSVFYLEEIISTLRISHSPSLSLLGMEVFVNFSGL